MTKAKKNLGFISSIYVVYVTGVALKSFLLFCDINNLTFVTENSSQLETGS